MQTMRRSFQINESIVAAELDNEMVLLNVETGLYFGLDELGAMIWSLIAAEADEAVIVDRIFAEYDVEQTQAKADVREFIECLEAKGLLQSESK